MWNKIEADLGARIRRPRRPRTLAAAVTALVLLVGACASLMLATSTARDADPPRAETADAPPRTVGALISEDPNTSDEPIATSVEIETSDPESVDTGETKPGTPAELPPEPDPVVDVTPPTVSISAPSTLKRSWDHSACPEYTAGITASATDPDESSAPTVSLTWSGAASGSGGAGATIGPARQLGSISVTATATDAAGNTATTTESISVVESQCVL